MAFFDTQVVLDRLQLEQIGDDRYRGQSHFMGSPNVFGGQLVGQALFAAGTTVPERRPHSLQSQFILPGNHRQPIEYEVERIRDGGSFSTRRVVAVQEGKRIFAMSVSFHIAEEGLSHQRPMPEHTDPDTLGRMTKKGNLRAPSIERLRMPVPVDFRADHAGDVFDGHGGTPLKQVWARAPMALPDTPLLHECLLAYVSDYGLLTTALQPHDVFMGDPRLQLASLDHTIWFHRSFRMDEWLLFAMETPNASGARGLSFAHAFNRQGVLVASLAQEGLIRIRADSTSGRIEIPSRDGIGTAYP